MYFKKSRIIDKTYLRTVRVLFDCIVCHSLAPDPHHIKSVGAGGDDTPDNILPLCRIHHSEAHTIGRKSFYYKYKPIIDNFRKSIKSLTKILTTEK